MTLQQLKYVIEIVNAGSINAAAERIFVAQPSLSSAVKELEKELGFEIFTRTSRGISLSASGSEFLGYARQVVEQAALLEERYLNAKPARRLFSVSTQHYAFSVNAFVNLVKEYGREEYEFTLRETKTHEIIEDVKALRSEVGVLYLSDFNRKVMENIFKQNSLVFTPLFEAAPHVFISNCHPLALQKEIAPEALENFPCLSFEQGTFNSFYFSEELHSTAFHKKSILVSDRATLFNLLIGLNGYTISTGVLSEDLNGKNIVSVPLTSSEYFLVGYITHKNTGLSSLAENYIEKLRHYIAEYGGAQ